MAPPPGETPVAPTRLVSVDALRGFIMFWIVGGDALVAALARSSPGAFFGFLGHQMSHSPWEGVTFYDLIFPMFIFIVGVSIVFSLRRSVAATGRSIVVRRILRRSVLLFVLGVIVYGGISGGWERVRWLGVLQRIALCYLCSGILFVFLKPRGLVAVFLLLLAGYWAALTFVPIRDITLEPVHLRQALAQARRTDAALLFQQTPEYVTGRFDEGLNVSNHFDFQYLPGKKWDGAYDPEGLLSTIPAIATCLFGVLAGLLMQDQRLPESRKLLLLASGGVVSILLGYLWGLQFPVIKKLWTSSYVLVAGGYSCLLLAAFHQMIDRLGWRRWCEPFLWFGMNSIAIYLVTHLIDFRPLADRLVGGPVKASFGVWGDPLLAATALLLVTALVRALYVRRIFLKL